MKTRLLFLLIFIGVLNVAKAQVSINQDGNDPHQSAMLDVSSSDKGLLIPRMSSSDRQNIEDPANGLMVFDMNTNTFWFFSNTTNQWEELGGAIVNVLNDLMDAKTDANSIYIGHQTAVNDDGDNFNTVLGNQALKQNSAGTRNTAMGAAAAKENTTGSENIALGAGALALNKTGNNNTAVGYGANGFSNTQGSHNVAIGNKALLMNAGSNNTAIGKGAGQNSSGNASGNVFIGHNAGMEEEGSNKLYIENSSSSTPLIGGNFETDEVNINGNLEVDGNLDINDGIEINGNFKLTSGNPETGKVLTSDANGNANWMIPESGGANRLDELEDVTKFGLNLFVGEESGSSANSPHLNIAIGDNALKSDASYFNNIGIGYHAGNNQSGSIGDGNIFIGNQVGIHATGGNQLMIDNEATVYPLIHGDFEEDHLKINGTIEIAGGEPGEGKVLISDSEGKANWEDLSGMQSIDDLTDGKTNGNSVYLGTAAGIFEENATSSTGVGRQTLLNNNGNNNNAFGFNSMNQNSSGSYNSAFGSYSIGNNTEGHYNVAVGNSTLHSLLSGDGNTAIGYRAGENVGEDVSGSVFIGKQAGSQETESNKLYIENSNSSTPLIGGDFQTDEVVINGTLQITGGNPGEGKVLISDANGKASWSSSANMSSINDLSDANADNSNIYLGQNSGENSNNNTYNNALGHKALKNNTNGTFNTVIGYGAMENNTSGSSNIAIGNSALKNSVGGSKNTAIGKEALRYNNGGQKNTAIGYNAGRNSSEYSASGGVFIGHLAGYNETEDNKLYIENTSSNTPLIGGDFATDEVVINGTLQITGGTPGPGKVLTSDANGKATWSNSAGANSINDLSDAFNDNSSIYLGSSGSSDDGNNKNTATGVSALGDNTSGRFNVAFGDASLLTNTTGSNNAAFGRSSMEISTSGNENTAIGSGALYYNGEGSKNTAIGFEAGFGNHNYQTSGNVFLGYKAGYFETGNNKLYIDNSDTYYPLVYGDFDQNKLEINGDFIVADNSVNKLEINNNKLISHVPIDANSAVEIAQTLSVDGELTANEKIIANKQIEAHEDIILSNNKNIKYQNARTAKIHYSGTEFFWSTYSDNDYDYDHYHEGTTLALTTEPYAPSTYFMLSKQIQLPAGAKIKNIKINFGGGPNDKADIRVTKRTPEQTYSEGEHLFESEIHFNGGNWTNYEFDFLVDPVIDQDYIYYIYFNAKVIADDTWGGMFGLNTVTIEYEYDTLNY